MTTADWPRGTVAFLFTDVAGSTGLWERHPSTMPAAYALHDAILRAAAAERGGIVYKVIGDAVQVAFPDAAGACAAAIEAQRELPSLNRISPNQTTYYCGSYFGYGFHEDAYTSAVEASRALLGSAAGQALEEAS